MLIKKKRKKENTHTFIYIHTYIYTHILIIQQQQQYIGEKSAKLFIYRYISCYVISSLVILDFMLLTFLPAFSGIKMTNDSWKIKNKVDILVLLNLENSY